MIEQELCPFHNEPTQFYDQSSERISVCASCIAQNNPNLLIKREVQVQMNQLQNIIFEDINQQYKKNKEILNQYIQKLQELKRNQETIIQKNINHINQCSNQLDIDLEKVTQSLQNLPKTNLSIFLNELNTIILNKIDFPKIKTQLETISSQLYDNYKLAEFDELAKEIDLGDNHHSQQELNQIKLQFSQQSNQNLKCSTHQLEIQMVDLNQQRKVKDRVACIQCISQIQAKWTPLSNFQEEWLKLQSSRSQSQDQYTQDLEKQDQQYLQNLNHLNLYLKNESNQIIKSLVDQSNSFKQSIQEDLKFNKILWRDLSTQDICQIAEILSQHNLYKSQDLGLHQKIEEYKLNQKVIVNKYLLDLFFELRKCYNLVNCIKEQNAATQTQKQLKVCSKIISLKLKFSQKLSLKKQTINIQQSYRQSQTKQLQVYYQQEWCLAITFSKDGKKIFAGSNNNIKVFNFENEKLVQSEILKGHDKNVFFILYLPKSLNLISGGLDGQLIVWDSKYQILQKIKLHYYSINCLVHNQNEDLLISGSTDESIIFLKKGQNWEQSFKLKYHEDSVQSLCLLKKDEILVSLSSDPLLVVSKCSFDGITWEVIITIDTESCGIGLLQLKLSSFIFIPENQNNMIIYELNLEQRNFKKSGTIKISNSKSKINLNPAQFNSDKQVLVILAGQFLNILRKKEKNYELQKAIQLSEDQKSIALSECGNYVIVWDGSTKQFQSYKLQ